MKTMSLQQPALAYRMADGDSGFGAEGDSVENAATGATSDAPRVRLVTRRKYCERFPFARKWERELQNSHGPISRGQLKGNVSHKRTAAVDTLEVYEAFMVLKEPDRRRGFSRWVFATILKLRLAGSTHHVPGLRRHDGVRRLCGRYRA